MSGQAEVLKENIENIVGALGRETGEFDGRSGRWIVKEVRKRLAEKYDGERPTSEEAASIWREVLAEKGFKKSASRINEEVIDALFAGVYGGKEIGAGRVKEELVLPELPALLPRGEWSEQALRVLRERYLWRDAEGNIIETPDELCWRVGFEIAQADFSFGKKREEVLGVAREYYLLMVERKFLPNSPTLMNAGKKNDLQYSACFVLPVGDSLTEIFETVKNAALIHKSGGGTGFSFSRIRPVGSIVKSTKGTASGPVSFLRVFNAATQEIKQGGARRGANMGILRVDHPDILEFIHCKESGGITNFNISVAATDKFMEALANDGEYELTAPHTGKAVGKIAAKRIFREICEAAWKTGDPGMIFIDRINQGRGNPVPNLGPIESTNPCGEQQLYPYDVCNLGSIFLTYFVKEENGKRGVDWEELKRVVWLAVRFLDSVIERNPYPLSQIMEMAHKVRRIGLGVGGWADMLAQLGLAYDSEEALRLAEEVMKFINEEGHRASEELAKERGSFPLWGESIHREGKPIRNATITTIAPTGTIAIIANASSGIEPYFALAYRHIVKDRGLDRQLMFVNPFFERKARERGFFSEELLRRVEERGVASRADGVPEDVRRVFKTAHEISFSSHVLMQAAFQKHTDNSVSKTINLPSDVAVEDVEKAYLLAYEKGCMGITVFRDGCKGMQVLNAGVKEEEKKQAVGSERQEAKSERLADDSVEDTAQNERLLVDGSQEAENGKSQERGVESVDVRSEGAVGESVVLRSRPYKIPGLTYRVETPIGTAFITINSDEYGNPMEVFLSVGKGGADVAADAEALGRLISLALRIPSPYLPKSVAEAIIEQLSGIGGSGVLGFGNGRVRSLADAVAKVLREHLGNGPVTNKDLSGGSKIEVGGEEVNGVFQQALPLMEKKKRADLCSSCGSATLVFEEGCYKCYACGFSKC